MKLFFFLTCIGACMIVCFSFRPQQDPVSASIKRGEKVYENTCLPCHQANGTGVPGMNPPLAKTKYVLGGKDTLINIVLNGLDEEIKIGGQSYGNPMPSQSQLKDAEIADVLTYVRNSFGNKAPAITAEEVKKVRK